MRRSLAFLVLAVAAGPLGAQAGQSFHLGPQYYSYKVGGTVDVNISQIALPVAVISLGPRMSVELATAWASSQLKSGSTTVSKVQGVTDTQLRGSYVFGNDAVVLTAGVNIPTGEERVTPYQLQAAGQIGNDFFAFPISNMGTGLAATGGIGVARPVGAWNLGAGVSVRHANSYEPFDSTPGNPTITYQPGDEYRGRVGVDRVVGVGVISFGLTYSSFGDDEVSGTSYSTGDRVVFQTGWSRPLGGADLSVVGWDLYRLEGSRADGTAPSENIANLAGSLGFNYGGLRLEPGVEMRYWRSEGRTQGNLATVSVRTQLPAGPLVLSPSVGLTTGTYSPDVRTPSGFAAGASSSVTGWRAVLGVRFAR